jgi:hypothetical protein
VTPYQLSKQGYLRKPLDDSHNAWIATSLIQGCRIKYFRTVQRLKYKALCKHGVNTERGTRLPCPVPQSQGELSRCVYIVWLPAARFVQLLAVGCRSSGFRLPRILVVGYSRVPVTRVIAWQNQAVCRRLATSFESEHTPVQSA